MGVVLTMRPFQQADFTEKPCQVVQEFRRSYSWSWATSPGSQDLRNLMPMNKVTFWIAMITLCPSPALSQGKIDSALAERFARLALSCVHREYPNKISHVLQSDQDTGAPRQLTPIFYGCFDWHSSVHGHWLLVRLCRVAAEGGIAKPEFLADARRALSQSFTKAKAAAEVKYLNAKGRVSFERPYGLAWLLQLSAELHEWQDKDSQRWAKILEPIEEIAVKRFLDWLPKLSHPIRTGEHSQSAFAMGLVIDWARSRGHKEMQQLIAKRGKDYYLADRSWNMAFEPGGQDFVSPGLAEADFMRRILSKQEFAVWLSHFLPGLSATTLPRWINPAVVTDKSDGKLAHLDGLNLSRAWMLDGIVSGLPSSDPRLEGLKKIASAHRKAGVAAVTGEDYAGGHWLGSFAVYLVTGRGID